MRAIKFRGKRYKHGNSGGDWVYGDFYHTTDGRACIDQWEVIEKTVGQYTGHQSIDAVEVYEGDIVKNPGDDHLTSVVVWNDEDGAFQLNLVGVAFGKGWAKIGMVRLMQITDIKGGA